MKLLESYCNAECEILSCERHITKIKPNTSAFDFRGICPEHIKYTAATINDMLAGTNTAQELLEQFEREARK